MKNNPKFPNDSNGEVLRILWEHGDDLSKAREFDFGVAFENEDLALDFAVALLRHEMKVSFSPAQEGDNVCEVDCHPVMIPDHAEISDFESSLAEMADKYGGKLSGWDCIVIKSSD